MTNSIDKKIVSYEVINLKEQRDKAALEEKNKIEDMHENVERPEMLVGATYKIKTPQSEHALYVTINDMVLNYGTENEIRRPFEIFINSKNLDHYQWIVALTRIISAVFRKGGDVTFLVEELKAVFDPRGGYWQPGGKFMPSIIADIGAVIYAGVCREHFEPATACQVAAALGVSKRSVEGYWTHAQAWLRRELSGSDAS